jgi:hypothetical protein
MIAYFYQVRRSSVYFGIVALLLAGLFLGVWGLDYLDEKELAAVPNQPKTPPPGKVSIVIKIQERTLELHNDGEMYKKYRIAVGKSDTPTPIGEWNVVWKDYNWGSGFGTRWMGLNVPWGIYGIHGTNNPWSIGRFASHGCIRMRNRDVEELFEWVPVGTEVKIVGRKVKVQRKLRYQMSGADVVILQLKLRELGHLNTRADGIFGPVTESAVKEYQSAQGLEATGVVDKQMVQLLGL